MRTTQTRLFLYPLVALLLAVGAAGQSFREPNPTLCLESALVRPAWE